MILEKELERHDIERIDTRIAYNPLPEYYGAGRLHFVIEAPEGYEQDVFISSHESREFIDAYRPHISVLPHDLRGRSLAVFYDLEKKIIGILPPKKS